MTAATLEKPVAQKIDQLDNAHRCDRCNAQAFVQVTVYDSDLLFCGHHFRDHEAKLTAIAGVVIIDERHRLNDKPSPSANAG